MIKAGLKLITGGVKLLGGVINLPFILLLFAFVLTYNWQDMRIRNAEKTAQVEQINAKSLETALGGQQSVINRLRVSLHEAITQYEVLGAKITRIEEDYKQSAMQIQTYRGRLDNAARKKPNLTEKIINRGLAGIMRHIQTETTRDNHASD